jgi:hypothetical protein
MDAVTCSVVAYLPEPLEEFVDGLRRRLNPRFADWRAHVSILPPRLLFRAPELSQALLPSLPSLEDLLDPLREHCLLLDPFEATLSEVQTFWPVNGVVYLSISRGADRLAELHSQLNSGGLARVEPYPFVPHVTIAQELDEAETHAALREASLEWARYAGTPSFRVESLSLVRQEPDQRWTDLAPIILGGVLKPSSR